MGTSAGAGPVVSVEASPARFRGLIPEWLAARVECGGAVADVRVVSRLAWHASAHAREPGWGVIDFGPLVIGVRVGGH